MKIYKMEVKFGNYSIKTRRENEITSVYDIIRKKWIILNAEEQVRQVWIHMLVYDLHISPSKIAIEKGFRINDRLKRFDICVYNKMATPELLIECKAPTQRLSSSNIDQISLYNIYLKCSKFVVTTGVDHLGFVYRENRISIVKNITELLE